MIVSEDDLDYDDEVCLYEGRPFSGTVQVRYANGSVEKEALYVDGFEQGLCREWHSTGQIKSQIYLNHGAKDGEITEWHENGQVKVVAVFKRGVELVFEEWRDDGSQVSHRVLDQKSDLWKFANRQET